MFLRNSLPDYCKTGNIGKLVANLLSTSFLKTLEHDDDGDRAETTLLTIGEVAKYGILPFFLVPTASHMNPHRHTNC